MLSSIAISTTLALACSAPTGPSALISLAPPNASLTSIACAKRQESPATGSISVGSEDVIRVFDRVAGCDAPSDGSTEVWKREGDAYVFGTRRMSVESLASLRALVLATTSDTPDLLTQVGITPKTIAAHSADIYTQLHREDWDAFDFPRRIPESVARVFQYDHLAPIVRNELLRDGGSTSVRTLRITLPGEPTITVASDGQRPWKLPWRIRVGAEERTCASLAISRAVIDLAPPESANRALLDGEKYWRDDVWWDEEFWSMCVDTEVEQALVRDLYSSFAGFAQTETRVHVENGHAIGEFGSHTPKLDLAVVANTPSVIDRARWLVPLVDRKPSSNWTDFLSDFDSAETCAERESWLAAWKKAGPERTIAIEVLDHGAYNGARSDGLVQPAWVDAGFQGAPEVQLLLMRGKTLAGKVYLSRAARGALILLASRSTGDHWFDALEVDYHASHPEYARVDALGRAEKRMRAK